MQQDPTGLLLPVTQLLATIRMMQPGETRQRDHHAIRGRILGRLVWRLRMASCRRSAMFSKTRCRFSPKMSNSSGRISVSMVPGSVIVGVRIANDLGRDG